MVPRSLTILMRYRLFPGMITKTATPARWLEPSSISLSCNQAILQYFKDLDRLRPAGSFFKKVFTKDFLCATITIILYWIL